MSDQRQSKKVIGRGRGKPNARSEGPSPWSRSKKLDDTTDVRPPKKDGEEFVLTESSFPPLPGAVPVEGIGYKKRLSDRVSSEMEKDKEDGRSTKENTTDETSTVKEPQHVNGNDNEGKTVEEAEQINDDDSNEDNTSFKELPHQNGLTESPQNGNSDTLTDNHSLTSSPEMERKPIIRTESAHDRELRLFDLRSNIPGEIVHTSRGERLLVKPSGRKFYINEDGSLGERKHMLDDLRRAYLYTQDHLLKLRVKRSYRKDALIKKLEDRLRAEDPTYVPQPVKVDVAKSKLSPFAVEFVPRALNMNPEAQDFIPTNGNPDETNNNPLMIRTSLSSFNVNDTPAILADLEETVNFCYSRLVETPADYDELIEVVTPHYVRCMENPDLPNEIVQSFFSYALQDTRFAYFAIKILMHLIRMTSTEGNKQLRDTLLRHTQVEVQNTHNYRLTDPNVSCTNDVQPFLMWLSELYIQLEVGGRRMAMIGLELVETLKKLLSTTHIPLKERLRLIVNTVKLTGLSLDQDDSTMLESLFTELSVVLEQESSNLDSPTVQFVSDVIVLRNLSWGLVEPEYLHSDNDIPTSPNGNNVFAQSNGYEPTYESNMGYTSGVFYGPDGNPINYEEQLFLEVETNALSHLQIDQGEPSPTSVEGFDEAYEEFLKTVPGHSSE